MSPAATKADIKPVIVSHNDLPEGWTSLEVQDIFNSFGGGTPNRATGAFWGGSIPWISSGDMKAERIAASTETITKKGLDNSSATLCRPGSVLVVVRSGILKHTLPVAILERQAAINQDIKCFDSGNSQLNEWFALALRSFARDILAANREGTTVQSVKYETLKEFALPIPPSAEQTRILAAVMLALQHVNAGREHLALVPRVLKRFRQSVLAAACSGRLTEDWREQHPAASVSPQVRLDGISQERRRAHYRKNGGRTKSYREPVGHDDDNLPETPPEWQWTSADAVCSQITDGEHIQPRYHSMGMPLLTAKHVRDGYVVFDDAGLISEADFRLCLKRCAPTKDDILIVSVGATTGRAAIVSECQPFAIVRSVLLLRPLINPHYLLRWVQSSWCFTWMTNASGASAQPHLYINDTKRMPIPLPSPEEQHEIVRRVEALFKLADAIEKRVAAAQARADKLTQSILAKAFRGELVPTEAELARQEGREYESASVLLERIRSQRSKHASSMPETRRKAKRQAST